MPTWQNVIERANADPEFRQRLIRNPAAACQEAGVKVPAGKIVRVIEPRPNEVYLVLNPPDGDLDEADLDAVAGGMDGIRALATVSHLQASNASEDAETKSPSPPTTPPTRPTTPKPTRPQ